MQDHLLLLIMPLGFDKLQKINKYMAIRVCRIGAEDD